MTCIDILSEETLRTLTGHNGDIAEPLRNLGFDIGGTDHYRIEDVRRLWAGERPSDEEVQKLVNRLVASNTLSPADECSYRVHVLLT